MSIIQDALDRTRSLGNTPRIDWEGSRFATVTNIGGFGEVLVRIWAQMRGHEVEPANDTVFDFRLDGRRAEVKAARIRRYRGHEFYNVYPHTADDFYLVAIEPARVRIIHLTNRQAEAAVGARHKLTLVAALRGGGEVVFDGAC